MHMIAEPETPPAFAPYAILAKQLMSGDEAVAWAALDAGICYASTYPGTPTTDIQEFLEKYATEQTRIVWSINEKVAYESALAVAIAGQRAMVSMKQVGLNVAADAFINSCTAGVVAGLVLVVGDDPECHSSSHKQDTRMYRPIAGTMLLEPADSQEAYEMTREAFRLSERFRLPIIIRLTMRTAYGSTSVKRTRADLRKLDFHWPKEPNRFFTIPTLSRSLFTRMAGIQQELADTIAFSQFTLRTNSETTPGTRLGIITTGIGYMFACEMAPPDAGVLKIAGDPYPDAHLRSFIRAHDRIAVLEEGDPILESRVRALAPHGMPVTGRISGSLKQVGELQPLQVTSLLNGSAAVPSREMEMGLPARIPEICKPCGYHKVFGALKEIANIATPSDIGCNTLGGLPPYSVMDGMWAMGSSIGVACGLAAIGHKRIVAIIGDSTFFHAGIPPLIEAVHEGYTMTVLLLDNGTAAMTGGQGVAHRKSKLIQNTLDLVRLIEALGVTYCTPFDPHKLGQSGIRGLVEKSFSDSGVKVLLYRSQCGIFSPGYFTEAPFALPKKE